MLTTDAPYTDLGGDYFTRLDPARATRRALAILEDLGYEVTLDRIEPNLAETA